MNSIPARLSLVTALLALAACVDPTLSADMAINNTGVSVKPTLSGTVGDATISVQSN